MPSKPEATIYTSNGTPIATDYTRVVFGKRGGYVEFTPEQIVNAIIYKPSQRHVFFTEWRTEGDHVMVYEQRRRVKYADYRVGMWYISPGDLQGGDEMVEAAAQGGSQ